MNIYDHEDAFKEANLCAGQRTALADVLKAGLKKEHALAVIQGLQDTYLQLFEAFIEGVDYGRKHPSEPKP